MEGKGTVRKWLTVIQKIQGSKYVDFIYVGVFAILQSIIVMTLCIPRWVTDDDWGIANYFAGVLDPDYATPYNKFINALWGWVMYGMYRIFPGVNWYAVIQVIIIILSISLLHYFLIQKMKPHLSLICSYLFSSVIILSFAPSYLCRFQFTQTSCIGGLMGFIWMMYAYEKKSRTGFIGAALLIITSALHRFGSFEMSLPFVGIVTVAFVLHGLEKKSIGEMIKSVKKNRRLLFSFFGIVAVLFAASKWNAQIYNSSYYKEYNEFNSARASVLDYKMYSESEISDELKKIDVSENDYTLLRSSIFADRSFFTADRFREIAKLQPKENADKDYMAEIVTYFINVIHPGRQNTKLYYIIFLVAILACIVDYKRMTFYSASILSCATAVEIYLKVYVNRYPLYVRVGLIFLVIASCFVITDYSRLKKKTVASLALILAIMMIPFGQNVFQSSKGSFHYSSEGLEVYEYLNSRQDDVFLIAPANSGGLPSLAASYSIFQETKPGIMRHVISLGGWSTNNPWTSEVYSSWGIDYPMSQVADDNVYLISNFAQARLLQKYLYEHKKIDTSLSLSTIKNGTTILKISNNSMETTGLHFANLTDVSAEFDSDLSTHDISVSFTCIQAMKGKNRLFLSISNEKMGINRYYMVFDGHAITLSPGEFSVTAKIPAEEFNPLIEYKINLLIQTSDGNYLNAGKSIKKIIKQTDNSSSEKK